MALILTRRVGESITITVPPSDKPTTVEVFLSEIKQKSRARLGFSAAKEVVIMRSEVNPDTTTKPEGN
jgi:sRNA-binding carbon storage regulator CsrA